MAKPFILVVDDQAEIRQVLEKLLKTNGYQVEDAADGKEAIEKIKTGVFDVVITDLKMEDYSGIEILRIAMAQPYDPEVLLITAFGSVDSAVEALKMGAYDYLEKPLDLKKLVVIIERALEKRKLKSEIVGLRREVEKYHSRTNIVAESPQMLKILESVKLLSRTDSTVLIEGESGTGKEVIARTIHLWGPRRNKPFIAVNCGALPAPLLESELFGHVKGAFTGAAKNKKGLFEEADGGTILLDEIGDMDLPLQIKLVRVLQDAEVRKVGCNFPVNVDTRIIAATNRKLESLIKEGKFREDLFYRLHVIPISVPPLRERREDIAPLLNHFIEKYSRKFKKKIRGFLPETLSALIQYDWPGNARELENFVERMVSLSGSSLIKPSELKNFISLRERPSEKPLSRPQNLKLSALYNTIEKEHILKILKKNLWNISKSTKDLGICRSSLWIKMKKHGIGNHYNKENIE